MWRKKKNKTSCVSAIERNRDMKEKKTLFEGIYLFHGFVVVVDFVLNDGMEVENMAVENQIEVLGDV